MEDQVLGDSGAKSDDNHALLPQHALYFILFQSQHCLLPTQMKLRCCPIQDTALSQGKEDGAHILYEFTIMAEWKLHIEFLCGKRKSLGKKIPCLDC